MTTKTPEHSLDHTTARIVTELAAALLPHLKETVSAELSRAVESIPVKIDRELEEALSSLRRLQALLEDVVKSLNSAQSSALLLSSELLPLSRTCETLNSATARIEQLADKPDTGTKMNELLRALDASLSDWEGILKANGHAQSKELSELSAEVSEQVGWMKSAMPGMVEEIFEKTLSPRTEERPASDESVTALEARLARLEKIARITLAERFIFIVCLVAIIAALYF